jgi:hypothetical protein
MLSPVETKGGLPMRTTSLEERVMICTLAQAGSSDAAIAQKMGWALGTVRKWRHRGKRGLENLASKRGRPARGALSTFAPQVRSTVQDLRHAHPGWGPLTLRVELEGEPPAAQLPSRSSIGRYLQQEHLSRPYERHQDLPTPTPASAQEPHQEWELDAEGYVHVPGVGVIAPINLGDRCSKVKLMSYPCWVGEKRASRHPTTADYQLVFRLTAIEWGLCDRLYVDRDSVYYDNGSKSPFPTRLHLWWLALGVELVVGPADRPTERGMIERGHQTWAAQAVEGQTFSSWEALYAALGQRRDVLNYRLPCASTGNQPPLVAYPAARVPRRPYRPEWEAELLDLARIDAYLATGRWFRKASNVGALCLGDQRYGLGKAWIKKEVEVTYDPTTRELVFYAPEGELRTRQAIKGLTKEALMGELGPLANLHSFQLALPFTWDEWRVIRLYETLGDTIL